MYKYINKKNITNFILIICLNFSSLFFHGYAYIFFGGVGFITIASIVLIFIFSFSLFKKSLYFLRFGVIGIILLQVLISSVSFPACSMNFKFPEYDCQCTGITKQMFAGTQCIGKVTQCYSYISNEEMTIENIKTLRRENIYHPDLKVSCENFPNNIYR